MVSITAHSKNTRNSQPHLLAAFTRIAGKAVRPASGGNASNARQDAVTHTALSTRYNGWSPNRKTCEIWIPAERF